MKKKTFGKLALAAAISTASFAANAIDIMFAFTLSGMEETIVDAGNSGDELGEQLINQINDTFEKSDLGRPFNVVGMYTHPDEVEYNTSVDLHLALRAKNDDLARDVEEKRNIYGADIVVFFWGTRDTPDGRYAGQGAGGSNIVAVWGKFATVDSIIEHELGHEFTLDHDEDPNSTSVMTIQNFSQRDGFDPDEVVVVEPLIPVRDAERTRDSDSYLFNQGLFTTHANSAVKYQTCDQLGSAKATWVSGVSQQTSMGFVNSSNEEAQVYWLDYSGNKNLTRTLAPGEAFAEGTATTHPFLVEANGECLGIVTNSVAQYEVIEINNRTQYTSSENYELSDNTSNELSYATCFDAENYASTWTSESELTSMAFSNQTSSMMNVFWLDYSGNKVLAHQLAPSQVGASGTATTHPFQIEVNGECVGVATNRHGDEAKTVTISDR